MFGFRTPKKAAEGEKSPVKPEVVPPLNVRLSIGEWEAASGSPTPTPSTSEQTSQAGPAKIIKPKSALTQEGKEAPRTRKSVDASPPSKPKYADRTAEAKACLTKAKLNMSSSRNTKTEIKTAITEATERLYQLVREAEGELKLAKQRITKLGPAVTEPEPTKVESQEKLVSSAEVEMESLKKALVDHSRTLKENSEKLDGLKEALKASEEHMEKLSYASVAASRPIKLPPRQTALHSIVVTSTKETETGEEILDHIRKAVNAKEGWVTVDRIRKAKDRKVVMGCKTEEEREKVKERLASVGGLLRVEDVKNRDPLVILRDVLTYNTDEDILKALRNQNKDVFEELTKEEDRVEVLFKKRTRNPHTHHVVLRVSPKLWNRLQEREAVHIDLQRIRVSDQSPLIQCSLCLGFGHGRRLCREQLEKCSHCGGPHLRANCADSMAGTAPSCCNCVQAKQENTEHNAFSEDCPVRKRCEVLARARVAYC